MYDRKYFCNHQILHHKAVLSKCISVITNCKFVKTLPLFDRRVYNFVPSSRFRFQCSALLSAVWMKCGYLPKKCFASDILCAGAKFNVTLSIMTSNSDVFLSLSPLLWWCCPAVCLVSVSPISESLLLCLEKEVGSAQRDIKLWLVDNLCHKYWDSHYEVTGPVSGVWTIVSVVWAHHLSVHWASTRPQARLGSAQTSFCPS